MSLKKNNHSQSKRSPSLNNLVKNREKDVVDRFLRVLWRREVDLKLTTK